MISKNLLVGIFIILVNLIFNVSYGFADTWKIEPVDAPKYFQESSIAVDSSGNVHNAYGGGYLYLHAGSNLQFEPRSLYF